MNRSKLEKFINIALIVAAIAFAGSLIARYVRKALATTKTPLDVKTGSPYVRCWMLIKRPLIRYPALRGRYQEDRSS
jgi:hypothetical protein